MKSADDYRIAACEVVSNVPLRLGEHHRHVAYDNIARGVANRIATLKVNEETREFTTAFRLEVYVVPHDAFWGLVEQEALRMTAYLRREQTVNDVLLERCWVGVDGGGERWYFDTEAARDKAGMQWKSTYTMKRERP